MYDLIGDIHGYATELKSLLTKMDYQEIDGVWQHPERKVIFLGDFVDRGPEQVEAVEIARKMVEYGNALAMMGNHEFNAVAWAIKDQGNPDQYLRAHNDKSSRQHKEFLDQQVGEESDLHRDMVDSFKNLPIYVDLPDLRVVHACWYPEYLINVGKYTDTENQLLEGAWKQSNQEGSEAFNIVETLLKSLEIPLPEGEHFYDKDGKKRTDICSQWWRSGELTYRDLVMVPDEEIYKIPHTPIKEHILPGYNGEKPVFVGHYWMLRPSVTIHIACLDYSVAGKHGGKLCAYRFGGERRLCKEKFGWVEGPKLPS